MIKLGILEQSPVIGNATMGESIARTVEVAKYAEQLGYHRFWVAEQHSMKAFASASPEIVAGNIIGQTTNMRVGVAGILVGHYAPLKVAENVNCLAALSNGRFDFGIGRTPGATPEVVSQLGDNEFMPNVLDDKSDEVFAYLDAQRNETAVPQGQHVDQRWILCGSIGGAAKFAAERGIPLAYAHFVNPQDCVKAIEYYREHFVPSQFLDKPYVSVATNIIVADTDEQAHYLAKPGLSYLVVSRTTKADIGFYSQQQADELTLTQEQAAMAEQVGSICCFGSKETVKAKLEQLLAATGADELAVLCIVEQKEQQKQTYKACMEIVNQINCSKSN